jgi:hypothetical protein
MSARKNPFDAQPTNEPPKAGAGTQAQSTDVDVPKQSDRRAEDAEQDNQTDVEVFADLAEDDANAEQAFPVENGAVRWDDAANQGDTSRAQKAVYDTPWGRRELSATEVTDFEAQGVPVTRVDAEPRTSLNAEREELRKIELTNKNADTTGH